MNRLRAFLTIGAGTLGTIASIVGIGSGISSMTGHGTAGGGGAYQPTGQGAADTNWQQIMQRLTGAVSGGIDMVNPNLVSAYGNLLNIDTSQLGPAGQRAGQYYNNLASNVDAMHNILADQGNQAGAAGRAVWNTAQDPQNALYNRTANQVQQQSRASDSSRGIAMSPVSAGLENQAMSNFNIDWQNNQLGRQIAGSNAMNNAFRQAGQDYTGAAAMGALAPQYLTQGATTPFQMNQMAAGWPIQASNMYGDAMNRDIFGPASGAMASIMPYLNFGQTASMNQFNQGQTGLNNFTTGLSQLGQAPIWNSLAYAFGTPQNSQNTFGTSSNIYAGGDNPYG